MSSCVQLQLHFHLCEIHSYTWSLHIRFFVSRFLLLLLVSCHGNIMNEVSSSSATTTATANPSREALVRRTKWTIHIHLVSPYFHYDQDGGSSHSCNSSIGVITTNWSQWFIALGNCGQTKMLTRKHFIRYVWLRSLDAGCSAGRYMKSIYPLCMHTTTFWRKMTSYHISKSLSFEYSVHGVLLLFATLFSITKQAIHAFRQVKICSVFSPWFGKLLCWFWCSFCSLGMG